MEEGGYDGEEAEMQSEAQELIADDDDIVIVGKTIFLDLLAIVIDTRGRFSI